MGITPTKIKELDCFEKAVNNGNLKAFLAEFVNAILISLLFETNFNQSYFHFVFRLFSIIYICLH